MSTSCVLLSLRLCGYDALCIFQTRGRRRLLFGRIRDRTAIAGERQTDGYLPRTPLIPMARNVGGRSLRNSSRARAAAEPRLDTLAGHNVCWILDPRQPSDACPHRRLELLPFSCFRLVNSFSEAQHGCLQLRQICRSQPPDVGILECSLGRQAAPQRQHLVPHLVEISH